MPRCTRKFRTFLFVSVQFNRLYDVVVSSDTVTTDLTKRAFADDRVDIISLVPALSNLHNIVTLLVIIAVVEQ